MGTATLLLALTLSATWTSNGVKFVMADKSLIAKQGDTVVFDLAKMTRDSVVQDEVTDDSDDMANWYASATNAVVSIVGTLVTYSYTTDSYSGGAHPNASAGYTTIDVSTPARRPSLYDFIPEAEVVSALRNDKFIAGHVSDAKAFASAKTVEALFAALDAGDDCVSFYDGSVRDGFAFHHLEKGKVALRVSLPYAYEACRGTQTILGLLVPSGKLGDALKNAEARTEGFLMKDAKTVHAASVSAAWESKKKG